MQNRKLAHTIQLFDRPSTRRIQFSMYLTIQKIPNFEFLLGSERAKVQLSKFQNSVVDNQNPLF